MDYVIIVYFKFIEIVLLSLKKRKISTLITVTFYKIGLDSNRVGLNIAN